MLWLVKANRSNIKSLFRSKANDLQLWKCLKTPISVWFESSSFHTWLLKFLHTSFPLPILLISSVSSSRSSKGHSFPRDQAEPILSFTGKAHIPDLRALCGRLPESQFFPNPGVPRSLKSLEMLSLVLPSLISEKKSL